MKPIKEIYNDESYGILPPPITDTEFRKYIIHYLAKDYILPMPISQEQVNTEMLIYILEKYAKRQLRKDLK